MVFSLQKPKTYSRRLLQALQIGTLALSTAFWLTPPAPAQMGASPLVIEEEANRGQVDAVINVINPTNTPLRARIYSEPFTYSDRGFETLPSITNYLGSYLQFSPRELTVPPNTTRRVRLVARLAPNLPDGEYRAAIFTETLNEAAAGKSNLMGITTRVATNIYIRKGNVIPNISVENASFNQTINQLQLLVQNRGNASTQAKVDWSLIQGERVIHTGDLLPSTVIAESKRNLPLNLFSPDFPPLSPGNYQLTGSLTWGNNNSIPIDLNFTIPNS